MRIALALAVEFNAAARMAGWSFRATGPSLFFYVALLDALDVITHAFKVELVGAVRSFGLFVPIKFSVINEAMHGLDTDAHESGGFFYGKNSGLFGLDQRNTCAGIA